MELNLLKNCAGGFPFSASWYSKTEQAKKILKQLPMNQLYVLMFFENQKQETHKWNNI